MIRSVRRPATILAASFLLSGCADTVMFARGRATLTDDRRAFRQLTPDDVAARHRFSPTLRYFAWSIGLFGIGIIPGMIDGFNAIDANARIRSGLHDKALHGRALAPEQSTEGFLYFDVAKDTPGLRLAQALTASSEPGDQTIEAALD